MNLMNDDHILLSFINTKLRDHYHNLDSLCEDLNIDKMELMARLNRIGYFYNENTNSFVCTH